MPPDPNSQDEKPGPNEPAPKTDAPIAQVFNQQNNFNAIPTTAWDRLSSDQTVDLTKFLVENVSQTEEKRLNHEAHRLNIEAQRVNLSILIGFLLAVVGIAAIAYLGLNGQTQIAGNLATALTTLIAVVTGARLFK